MRERRALVVDYGYGRNALVAVRALHAAGWRVGVGAPDRRAVPASSRAATAFHPVPPVATDVGAFVAAVARACADGQYDVVFVAEDAELLALSLHRGQVPAPFPYPPHEAVLRAVDKLELAEAAAAAGISTPVTCDASDEAIRAWEGPAIVKARLHASLDGGGAGYRADVQRVEGTAAIAARVAELRAAGRSAVLQAPVDGSLMALSVVSRRDGGLAAVVQQMSQGTWPASAGVTARAVTVPPDRVLVGRVEALLVNLGWFGIAQLQFLLGADGVPRLIDFNGRFYGSLQLAVGAGANLPAIWAALAIDEPPGDLTEARAGVGYQWLYGDLRRAMVERRGGLLRDVWATVRASRAVVHATFDPADVRPTVRLGAFRGRRVVARVVSLHRAR
jgi:predicted ATP-grasp superfamily ATP-dependent carboligase